MFDTWTLSHARRASRRRLLARRVAAVPVLAGCLAALAPVAATEAEVERVLAAMGTVLTIRVEAPTREAALAASERAYEAVRQVEARLSTWSPDSELARLNRATAPVPLSPELTADLVRARHWFEATDGAFDPGLGALVDAWDLRGAGRRPQPAELERALATGGLAALEFDSDSGRARRLRPGLRIEEGGFGKGVALDAALAALRSAGVTAGTVDLGGQVASFGKDSERWQLADPRSRHRAVLEFTARDGSFATSGNSERGIEVDGRWLGHLLDPRTGQPCVDWGSMTVFAGNATDADCLSTGLYVQGPEAGLRWAARHAGIEAISIEVRGADLLVRATPGLRERLRALASEEVIQFIHSDEHSDPTSTPSPRHP